jgi:hypothetical protein
MKGDGVLVHYTKVINGLIKYIDADILAQMNGSLGAWGAGIIIGLIAKRAEQVYHTLANNALVKTLGVVDGEMIDIESIYAEALKAAQKGSATATLPVIGPITFKTADVESVYRHIIGG